MNNGIKQSVIYFEYRDQCESTSPVKFPKKSGILVDEVAEVLKLKHALCRQQVFSAFVMLHTHEYITFDAKTAYRVLATSHEHFLSQTSRKYIKVSKLQSSTYLSPIGA